jgi:hypothetical protein
MWSSTQNVIRHQAICGDTHICAIVGLLKDVLKGEIVGRFAQIMLADRHVGSKRGMPIHRLLNEDAVALVIASIPTRPALSTNDSRPLFIRPNNIP